MKLFFFRSVFILALVFFEFSFLDVLFPWIAGPLVLIGAITAWGLILPFPQVFFMSIPLSVAFDIVTTGKPGLFSLFAVLLVYVVGFLSKRFLLEQRGAGVFLYVVLAISGIVGYALFETLFSQGSLFALSKGVFFSSLADHFSKRLFYSLLLGVPIVVLINYVVQRFEEYMRYMKLGEVLKIR